MIQKIESWIDQVLADHAHLRIPCTAFAESFAGFYDSDFLARSYYVVTDVLPKPNFQEIYDAGLGGFIEMDADGITYKDTYFIKPNCVNDLVLHFHELVHVAQWKHLGAHSFIEKYINEYDPSCYEESPLEKMAYSLERIYAAGGMQRIDIVSYVEHNC